MSERRLVSVQIVSSGSYQGRGFRRAVNDSMRIGFSRCGPSTGQLLKPIEFHAGGIAKATP